MQPYYYPQATRQVIDPRNIRQQQPKQEDDCEFEVEHITPQEKREMEDQYRRTQERVRRWLANLPASPFGYDSMDEVAMPSHRLRSALSFAYQQQQQQQQQYPRKRTYQDYEQANFINIAKEQSYQQTLLRDARMSWTALLQPPQQTQAPQKRWKPNTPTQQLAQPAYVDLTSNPTADTRTDEQAKTPLSYYDDHITQQHQVKPVPMLMPPMQFQPKQQMLPGTIYDPLGDTSFVSMLQDEVWA